MKRIATTIAVAAIAIGASATTASARCDCGDDGAVVATIGTAVTQDQQAQAPAAIDDSLAEAKTSARKAKAAEFGSLDVAIATAVAAHQQHVALVPEVKAVKAKAHKRGSRPAKVLYRGPH
jgi:hypothetical protein